MFVSVYTLNSTIQIHLINNIIQRINMHLKVFINQRKNNTNLKFSFQKQKSNIFLNLYPK